MLLPDNEQTVLYGGDDARCAIIYGTPGVGKSDLAIHFAFTRRERFDAIFWIQAEEHAQLEEDFASIATHLNLEAEDGASNLVVQRDLAKCWLQDQKQQNPQARSGEVQRTAKWLIIFDNADNDGLLEEYRDIVGCGSIIITSRSPARRPLLPQTTLMIDLQPFSNADGAKYLQQRCGLLDDSQSQKAADISERLGGNPLGLTQMSGLINEELMDFDEFVNRYDKPDERFELLRQAGEGDSRERFRRGPVALVFAGDVLFKKPGSRQLLEISSFLDPGKIHQEILLEAAIGKDILEGYPKTQGEFYAARGALLRTSLIQRHQGEEGKDFSVHRLVQDAVRARMDDARILLVVNGVLRLLTHAWGSDALDERYKVEKWRGKPRIVPHVLCIRRFLTQWKKSRTPEVDLRFANLLSEAGWWFFERSQMRDCRDMLDSAMDVVNVEQTFGEFDVRSLVSDLHYGLGALASESNDIDSCKKHFQRLLQLRKDSGKTNSRLADAQNEMGVSLMMQGQVAEALEMFERSIETYKSLGSAYREGMESFPMVNSGQALWTLGRLTDAAAILDKGLGMREAAFGRMDKESFRTGRFLHLLGNVRWEQSVLETTDLDRRRTLQAASEQHHRDALQQYRSTIGDLHHRTADVCHKVAQHCLRKGDLRQANSQIAEALKAWSVEPVTFKNEIARTTFLRAQCGKAASLNQEAQVLLIQAAKLREETLQSRGEASDGKAPEELQEKDFDKLVTFWSQ